MNKLISIIIPVKNGSNYLKEAIDNIKKQDMNVEIIVVNDASTDNTSEIAKQCGCIVIDKDKSEGQVKGKNDGLQIANGEYIMFHDHDDIMQDGVLKKLYDEIEADNSVYAVEAKVQDWFTPELSEEERAKTAIKAEPYWGLFTGAILIKKSVFDVIGLFNASVMTGEIIEWQSKMEQNNFTIKKVDLVSTKRRIHTTNFGKTNQKTEMKNYAAILRAKLRKN